MTGERYWKKRAEQRLVQAERASAPYLRKIAARYRAAAEAIERDIRKVFDTYRQDFTRTEAEAFLREEIPMAEYNRLKALLPQIQDGQYRKELAMRLNAQSYRYRITRMQYVRQLILARLSEGADYEKRASSELYRETVKEGYLRTLFDIQKGVGIGFSAAMLPEKTIGRMESARWYGRNYSASVWRNRGLVAEAAASVLESGILAGQSIRRMSREMMEQTYTHSVSNAARLIRTEVNYFCNQGALEGYREAEIEEYEFLATLDLRTSAACRELDGKKFPLAKAQPGKNCPPMHPYCRSTVVPIIDTPGLARMEKRAARDTETGKSVQIGDMSYEEWKEWQKSGNPDIWDTLIRKGKNRSADRQQYQEYRKILGGKIPSRFDDFQNLKYNEPEKWEKLKKQKRQLVFLENADCVTTPKKFTGYFLKPGAKHADEFFDVGYTSDDPVQLRYDMAKQFDVEKAVEFSKNPNGQEKFSIFMDLGVTKSRTFRTVWQKDTPDSAPRIITAHREGTKND